MDRELLDILACPLCHGAVALNAEVLVCSKCGRKYPVKDGIPIMIIEESVASAGTTNGGDERKQ